MNLVTEYLTIIERDSSQAFYHLCDTIKDFKKLLQTDSNLVIKSDLITYKANLTVKYEITTGRVEGKNQRFFQIRITFNGEEDRIDEYVQLLRSVKSTVYKSGVQPETLWDDISSYYASKSYPYINKIENLMRKLITYFMLTNIGKEGVVETSPNIVKDAINKSKRKQYVDVLYQIDFIHLGDFLFKPYQTKNIEELHSKLENANAISDLNLEDLKEYRSKSNWERYFSKVVECTNDFLDKRWTELYELRCMIAHNAIVGKTEYERIVLLVGEVSRYLEKAIDNLGEIHVPTEDKEFLAENVAINLNTISGEFINLWRIFETTLTEIAQNQKVDPQIVKQSPIRLINFLADNGFVNEEVKQEALELAGFRNRLVHGAGGVVNEQEVISHIELLSSIIKNLNRTWKDEVIKTLIELGGQSSLSEIYEYIEEHSKRKLPDTWKSAVRKTLQTYSSDTESFKGGEDLFEHLDKGLWKIRNQEEN